ncbi:hypothetical protein [Herbaspirillum sp. YR522]|uniref:hypothetical protein n=1 Tax=Herbaspirillum sp. YR522 TaxID=1144342 RepID=UPI00026F6D54|nr:hypothetical protein [Herbaspirillum sp. YR522]EJN10130.1 hypothetical protein PMI40_00217 [Herbaspirillum sp. YR522]
MTVESANDDVDFSSVSTTAPAQFSVTARGAFPSEEDAHRLATVVGELVRVLSRKFDLSRLDGVTVAEDYAQALAELDRGYESSHTLTPSEGAVVGVAMTPSVLRDDVLKCHIVFNARYLWPLKDTSDPTALQLPLHIVAHECAHVEVTGKFEAAIPGLLLRSRFTNLWERARSDVIFACWDEYAVTLLCAGIGADPTESYEETLITNMGIVRQEANEAIKAYRLHSDLDQVYREVYRTYANLLKYASYYLGNLAGRDTELSVRPNFEATLAGHWFEEYFHRLDNACKAIMAQYGMWQDLSLFEVVADIADDMVAEGGIIMRREGGQLYIDIPFTAETMP